jgi:predicted RecB family endonuclease
MGKRKIIGLCLVLILGLYALDTSGQSIHVPVRFKIERGDFKGTRVDIVNKTDGTTNSKAGRSDMKLVLKPNCDYILEFNKPGYITKKISLSTKIPASRLKQGMDDFPFKIHLFPQVDDVNIVVFNQPVGIIYYDRLIDDLNFDTDYTKQVRSAIKKAEEEIMKKAVKAAANAEQLAKEESRSKKKNKNTKSENSAKRSNEKKNEKSKELAKDDRGSNNNEDGVDKRKTLQGVMADDRHNFSPGVMGEDVRPLSRGILAEEPRDDLLASADGLDKRNLAYAIGYEDHGIGRRMAAGIIGFDEYVKPEDRSLKKRTPSAKKKNPVLPTTSDRKVEVVKESNREITKVTVSSGDEVINYRKVIYSWGAKYYFKESTSISKELFSQATGMK